MRLSLARAILTGALLSSFANTSAAQYVQPSARVEFRGEGRFTGLPDDFDGRMSRKFEAELLPWLFLRPPTKEESAGESDYVLHVALVEGSSRDELDDAGADPGVASPSPGEQPDTSQAASKLRPVYLEFSFSQLVGGQAQENVSTKAPLKIQALSVKHDPSSPGADQLIAVETATGSTKSVTIENAITKVIEDLANNSNDLVRGLLCQIPLARAGGSELDSTALCTYGKGRAGHYLSLPVSKDALGLAKGTEIVVIFMPEGEPMPYSHAVVVNNVDYGVTAMDLPADLGSEYVPETALPEPFTDWAQELMATGGGRLELSTWEGTPAAAEPQGEAGGGGAAIKTQFPALGVHVIKWRQDYEFISPPASVRS